MGIFDNRADFIDAALAQLTDAPACPVCASPVVFISQGGTCRETGVNHCCALELIDRDGDNMRQTIADMNAANAEAQGTAKDAEAFSQVILSADTVDDLLR